mgnify:CR=1 FL=1
MKNLGKGRNQKERISYTYSDKFSYKLLIDYDAFRCKSEWKPSQDIIPRTGAFFSHDCSILSSVVCYSVHNCSNILHRMAYT